MNRYKYNDYYQMQETFDDLYARSQQGETFDQLMSLITSEENIKLAFRMIKTNTGSKTAGTDGVTISEVKAQDIDHYVAEVRKRFNFYKPGKVRRVLIPKENGKFRPLGIPTMIDRLIQQSVKQILEPICEAKFYKHNYGFRPNRGTKDAMGTFQRLTNINGLSYVVDIDIKGFFDNVNHTKLIKQMWHMGIRDRKLIAIIKAMLKAPVEGIGVPSKGTPQGGILSPLLSNIVLNELDWWISSQWENMPTRHAYVKNLVKYKALKTSSRLKEVFIVRYADDFKLLCRTRTQARIFFEAVTKWLKDRLGLDISPEKSKIVNLKKGYSEFLGYRFKLTPNKDSMRGHTCKSHMSEKSMKRVTAKIKDKVIDISKDPTAAKVNHLNSIILGVQEYFRGATETTHDFRKLAFSVNRLMFNRFRNVARYGIPAGSAHGTYHKFYGKSRSKTWVIGDCPIYLVHYARPTVLRPYSQSICEYTPEGRKLTGNYSGTLNIVKLETLLKSYIQGDTVEYNDNRISRASMAGFKCEVTGIELEVNEIHCHHVTPRAAGGSDAFDNLRIVSKDVHILIHAQKEKTINKLIHLISNRNVLKKLNTLRSMCNLPAINLA